MKTRQEYEMQKSVRHGEILKVCNNPNTPENTVRGLKKELKLMEGKK